MNTTEFNPLKIFSEALRGSTSRRDTVDSKARFMRLAYPQYAHFTDESLAICLDELTEKLKRYKIDFPSDLRMIYCPIFGMEPEGPFRNLVNANRNPKEAERERFLKSCRVL